MGVLGVGSVVIGLNLRRIHGLALHTMCSRQTPEIVFRWVVSYSKYSRPNVFRFSDLIFFWRGEDICICIVRSLGNGPKPNPKFMSIVYTPYMLPEGNFT